MALDHTKKFKEMVEKRNKEEEEIREEFNIPSSFKLFCIETTGYCVFTRLDEEIRIYPDGTATKTWWGGPAGSVTKPWNPT